MVDFVCFSRTFITSTRSVTARVVGGESAFLSQIPVWMVLQTHLSGERDVVSFNFASEDLFILGLY